MQSLNSGAMWSWRKVLVNQKKPTVDLRGPLAQLPHLLGTCLAILPEFQGVNPSITSKCGRTPFSSLKATVVPPSSKTVQGRRCYTSQASGPPDHASSWDTKGSEACLLLPSQPPLSPVPQILPQQRPPWKTSDWTSPHLRLYLASWGHCCFCSAAQSRLTLCGPMHCSMPGFPVLHCLLESAQIHIHWVTDAI